MANNYKICTRCIMDTTDQEIVFDEKGVCNHCRRYEERAKEELYCDESGQQKLKDLISGIKEEGKNKKYDYIIGISGGVDNTMVAYTVKKLGLRPLAIHLDNSWSSDIAIDNIKNTVEKLGKVKLKTFPQLTLFNWVHYTFVKRIKFIPILNYISYVKEDAKKLISEELRWRDYSGKHYESVYTRFFQGYILPKKFNVDKKRAHLSTLICSNQTSREEALRQMQWSPYPSEKMMEEDKKYVIKKLGLTEKEFEEIMYAPIKGFQDYPNKHFLFSKLNFFVKLAKKKATLNY